MENLDILKEEMAALKRSLDKEQIVNDRLLRTVMRQKASWLNSFVKLEVIMLPVIYLMFAGICAFFHISQWYALSLLLFSALDVIGDLRTFRISPKVFSTYSMMEVRNLLVKQKKERMIHVCIATPIAIGWLVLILSAIATASHDPLASDHAINMAGVIGGVIGGIIGGIVVIIIYRKAQRTNDCLIHESQPFLQPGSGDEAP